MSILQYTFFVSFFKRFFWCGPFFKVFIEFVTLLLLFYVLVFIFGPEAWGFLVHLPGIVPTPPALEVLTTGPPGKSLFARFEIQNQQMLLLKTSEYRIKCISPIFQSSFLDVTLRLCTSCFSPGNFYGHTHTHK